MTEIDAIHIVLPGGALNVVSCSIIVDNFDKVAPNLATNQLPITSFAQMMQP